MAKITRKNQKIFCGGVPAANVVAQFGSLKAGSPAYTNDPDVIQSLSAYDSGWAGAVISNNSPALQDMNSLQFLFSRQLAYIFQSGIPEWVATATYYIGSLVTDATGAIYMSLSDDNLNQALTDATKWFLAYSRKIQDKTGNYTVDNTDWMVRGTGSSALTVTIPQATSTMKGRELVIKSALTGGVILSINCTGGSTIDGVTTIYLSQFESKRLICNGTTWDIV
jgi:hypothetical protein